MDFDRGLLLLFVGILAILSVTLVMPYVQFVVGAVLLAFVLEPVHRYTAPRIGPTASAAVLTVGGLLAIVAPLVFVMSLVAGDAMQFARNIAEYDLDYETVGAWIEDTTGREVDVQSTVESQAQSFAESLFGSAIDLFGTLTHLMIGFGLFLFLIFFFVRDGDKLVDWIRSVSPMPDPVTDGLLERIYDITRAVLAGHVLVAIFQGVVAGIGVAVVGVPNPAFWTFVMIILSLIPIVGSFLVWAPASVWLFTEGDVAAAVGLFVYGVIVVGFSDDYVRPVVVDRYARVSPAIIVIGVVGGMSVWGFMGLFVGPIVVAVLKESVEVYAKFYGTEAEPTDEEQAEPEATESEEEQDAPSADVPLADGESAESADSDDASQDS